MYLINARTLELERFDARAPRYAILSHRWREGEVSFSEFQEPSKRRGKAGFAKILATCAQARKDLLSYAWVDTCCIDKSSSAELSEAINSMYKWYQKSKVCYAYLDDVSALHDPTHPLEKSDWFTRGWTLQELIAPVELSFFCNLNGSQSTWDFLGDKHELIDLIRGVTHIPEDVLSTGIPPRGFTVSERMRWAAGRKTTREEDKAYCLMGLFDVNMPLLYGEGNKAFLRLQEEIVRNTDDDTIFAWREGTRWRGNGGVLAPSPSSFRSFIPTKRIPSMDPGSHLEITSKGLRTNTTVSPTREMLENMGLPVEDLNKSYLLLPLNCYLAEDVWGNDEETHLAILLEWWGNRTYFRSPCENLFEVKAEQISRDTTVFVVKWDSLGPSWILKEPYVLFQLPDQGIHLLRESEVHKGVYSRTQSTFHINPNEFDSTDSQSVAFGFVFHLEGKGRLVFVAIELSGRSEWYDGPQGRIGTHYRMAVEIVPATMWSKMVEAGLAGHRDRLLSEDTRAAEAMLVTQDLEVYGAGSLRPEVLRVSLVKHKNAYVLKLSFLERY